MGLYQEWQSGKCLKKANIQEVLRRYHTNCSLSEFFSKPLAHCFLQDSLTVFRTAGQLLVKFGIAIGSINTKLFFTISQ